MKYALRKGIALLFILFVNTALGATPKQYQVELILFSHFTPQSLSSETWPTLAPPSLSTPTQTRYTPLPASQFKLNAEAKRLAQTAGYTVLMHTAWVQPIDNAQNAKPIQLLETTPDGAQITGILTLSVRRYLEAELNLWVGEPLHQLEHITRQISFTSAPTDTVYFQLNQKRRMRSKELNYLGHPLFGILIEIFPITEVTA